MGETIQVIDRFHKRYDNGDSDFHIIILTYFLPLSLSLCSNGTSVSLQIEETSEMVGNISQLHDNSCHRKKENMLRKLISLNLFLYRKGSLVSVLEDLLEET